MSEHFATVLTRSAKFRIAVNRILVVDMKIGRCVLREDNRCQIASFKTSISLCLIGYLSCNLTKKLLVALNLSRGRDLKPRTDLVTNYADG